ncbi:MAG: response regulator [Pseudomonadota bacterium]|nr:response regulator [Pseudomonadota bacterium]
MIFEPMILLMIGIVAGVICSAAIYTVLYLRNKKYRLPHPGFLKDLEQVQKTFLVENSHSPLTRLQGIIGLSELYKSDSENKEIREAFQLIFKSGLHLHQFLQESLFLNSNADLKKSLTSPPKKRSPDVPILIAEDNEMVGEIVKGMLNRMGLTCHWVKNGREAVEAVEKNDYSLILMDIMMPGMDGLQATLRIREMSEAKRTTPIVAVTANAKRGDKEKCFAAGMDAYVCKPLVFENIKNILETYLDFEAALKVKKAI